MFFVHTQPMLAVGLPLDELGAPRQAEAVRRDEVHGRRAEQRVHVDGATLVLLRRCEEGEETLVDDGAGLCGERRRAVDVGFGVHVRDHALPERVWFGVQRGEHAGDAGSCGQHVACIQRCLYMEEVKDEERDEYP